MAPVSQTRHRIVRTAMELFTLQGYQRTGLARVAKAAGVLPGSVYHFFPTKEDLVRATLEERKKLLYEGVLQPVWERIDDPLERVFGLLDQYRQMLLITEFAHGCPVGNLAIEMCETHPNTRELICDNFDGWLRAVSECFHAAADRLPEDTDPEQLAVFTLTTMEGAVMLARTYRSLVAYDAAIHALRDYIDRLVASATSDWVPPASDPAANTDPAAATDTDARTPRPRTPRTRPS